MLYRFLALLLLQAAFAVPGWSQWLVGSHLASDGSLAGTPIVAGATLTSVTNDVGFRMGFSIDAQGPDHASSFSPIVRPNRPAWSGEADVLYFPLGMPGATGVVPYGRRASA